MVSPNIISKTPKDILELEKLFQINLNEVQNKNVRRALPSYSYSLNKAGKVNGISITDNKGIKDISWIRRLNSLESINLTMNMIEDITPLSDLPNLKYAYLGKNQIKDLSPLSKLNNLIDLIIWGNPIKYFEPLNKIKSLQRLHCQETDLLSLEFLADHQNLMFLNADRNKIQEISVIPTLKKIKKVFLAFNKIEDLSPLNNLNKSIYLDLSNNCIKKIPKIVAERFKELYNNHKIFISNDIRNLNDKTIGLAIENNPLEFPPYSVIELGPDTLNDYYSNSDSYGYGPLSEGRIIVVGDGSAGKSSLIEKILYNTFEQGKSQTNGIKIENWNIQHEDGRNLIFHIWDFGGQEIQHAVHKFFFTEGCLYILVLDNRKEEEPEYWLQQIESLGGSAPVLVVFNKQDDNTTEIADRKFLKEKYPNIIGFFNTSCKTSFGISDFKNILEKHVIKLRTVDEQFPNNWFNIKKEIEACTSGSQHYLTYEVYSQICKNNNADAEETQKLLLKYFTTIGAVTWFGDTFLNFLHILSPAWITQGVYKIITSNKTTKLSGHININDFKELLLPLNRSDYCYEESHYGYILMMMKKFGLCYTPDDINILLPSAFGKVPKLEYSEFRGNHIRTYILQFKDYMPLALIHRFIAKKLPNVHQGNYWYSGIVIKDNKSDSLAMIHADKEAKRIYIRIKGEKQLGMWEHIRRELDDISSDYAKITFNELILLEEKPESTVAYEDLVSHITANKSIYFHPRLQQDFNVGYLMGFFETKEQTLEKFKRKELNINEDSFINPDKYLTIINNNLNNNSPVVSTNINNQIEINIDIQLVHDVSSNLKGDALYLIEELENSNKTLKEALMKVVEFSNDSKSARNSGDVKEKGWGIKLKGIIQTLSSAGDEVKKIEDGGAALKSILDGIKNLAAQFNMQEIKDLYEMLTT